MVYALIAANGDLVDGEAVQQAVQAASRHAANSSALIIAADGGLRHLIALQLSPDLVIGDMDSAEPAQLDAVERAGGEIMRFSAHKNETDLELAVLEAVKRGADVIRIIGALGDRFDQSISNVHLLALPELRGSDARLVSGKQTLSLSFPGETILIGNAGDTVSLIPVAGDASGIVTEQLEYPLRHETLKFGAARGVSNVMLGTQASFTFETGVLLVVHTIGRA
jgi:thiamine pyrophosphokinase